MINFDYLMINIAWGVLIVVGEHAVCGFFLNYVAIFYGNNYLDL